MYGGTNNKDDVFFCPIQTEAVKTEGQIKEEFEKLHQFLRDEEESRLATLREEIKTKRTKPTDRLLHLDQKVELLEENIREIEEDIEADVDEVIFLQVKLIFD